MEIIKAVDNSAEGETVIRVFHLKYANPTEVANDLAVIFPSSSGGGGTQPVRFGGGAGGGMAGIMQMMGGATGGRGGRGAAGGGGGNARIQKQTTVIAQPDLRTMSVIVTASSDMITEIENMVKDLDVSSPERDQKVFVRQMEHGDVMADLAILQTMFGGNNSRNNSSSSSALQTRVQQSAQQGGAGTTTSGSSGIGGSSSMGGGGGGGGGGRGGF
jgi:hypothetical protein